uniref:acylglycerol lipase n=1 Tax=Podarcis muralis TaxID=64176 RepID=A0A670J9P2_PODMU
MKVKFVEHEGYRFCYFCRGKPGSQPSVLMLHGFSFNKDMWLDTIKLFPKDLHVVCLDMPGHGETIRLLAESYTAVNQAKMIHQFVECIGLNQKPFHLVGMSMGGTIAGIYAAQYPSDVSRLSLLCPPGLRNAADNEFIKRLKELRKSTNSHSNPLVPLTVKQGERQQAWKCSRVKRPQKQASLCFFLGKGFLDMSSKESRYHLHDSMSKIRAPAQIIWGREDKVMDPSGAEMLAKAIPSSQVHMLEKCGHFITLDRPRKLSKLLLEFHYSVCGTAENKKMA